jgi:hypothetical protein
MEDFRRDGLNGLDYFESRLLNIPVGWWLSEEDRNHIVEVVNNYEVN